MTLRVGPYVLDSPVLLAPMAGVSDLPFREIARQFGVGLAVSEMVSANPRLWQTRKSGMRVRATAESGLRSVQIVGTEPDEMAAAARFNVEQGAQIIDINMGCPAKKVCNKQAGSALLRDEGRVAEILQAVVGAVDVPVTLKMRTGWSPDQRNGVQIARIAEDAGIAALTVHGRTRACAFRGEAEYDTIAAIRQAMSMPLIANGDIDSASKARAVLAHTGADAVMIGRAAFGNPWLLRQIRDSLLGQENCKAPSKSQIVGVMIAQLKRSHEFYGFEAGVKIVRKHLGWYCERHFAGSSLKAGLLRAEAAEQQLDVLYRFLENEEDEGRLAA